MEHFNEFKKNCDVRLEKCPQLKEMEAQVGVEKFFLAAGGIIAAIGLLFAIGGGTFLVNLVGFLYPAYMSFKALSTPQPDDDTQWLTYWVVYTFFNLVEQLTDIFVSWIPFYFFLKIAFLVWCFLPQTLGANTIYHKFLKPMLEKHMSKLDAALGSEKRK